MRARTSISAAILAILLPALIPPAGRALAGPQAAAVRPGGGPDVWVRQAHEHIAKGAVFEALEAFERAVASDPGRLDIRLEFAALLKQSGFWLRSADQYKAVLAAEPGRTDALIEYGELLNAEYQFAAAVEQFSRALQSDPGTHERERAMVGMGSAYFGLESYGPAAQVFQSIVDERPNVLSAVAFLAIAKRKLGQLGEAEKLWDRYLSVDTGASRAKLHRLEIEQLRAGIERARATVHVEPTNAGAWARLGDLLKQQPDPRGAAEAYHAAATHAPSDASIRFRLGLAQRDLGLWGDAAASFEAVGGDLLLGSPAAYNQAWCHRRLGDYEAEAAAWERVVRTNPADQYAYRRKIDALAQAGSLSLEKTRAASEAASHLAARPAAWDAVPLVRLGLVALASGDTETARRAAFDAMRLDINDVAAQKFLRSLLREEDQASFLVPGSQPRDAAAFQARAAALLALGKDKEAEPALRELVAADGRDPRSLVALASVLRRMDRAEEAVRLLEEARAARPDYLYAHLDLALELLDAGDYDAAVASGRQAIRLREDSAIAHAIVGAALRGKGDLPMAAAALQRAVALDPTDDQGSARLMLAKVYGAMGRYEDARATLKGSLPEEPDEIYRVAWEFVRDTYHDRTFNGQNWNEWRRRFDGRLKNAADAMGAVALMLSSLDDRNTRLRSADQTANLLFSHRAGAPEFGPTGAALTTSGTVETRRLEGNVGYIAITNLDDPRLPAEIDKAVEKVKSSDAVILDLRGNQGGADSDVPRIAGMFVKEGTPTGTIVDARGTSAATAEPATPSGRPLIEESKPVVVLVDRHTASSAENLAGSLKESGRAVLVGEKTYGKSGVQLPRLLPGGATVLVVGAEHADLAGAVYTGVGIRPDVSVEGATRRQGAADPEADDPALRKAREILKSRRVKN